MGRKFRNFAELTLRATAVLGMKAGKKVRLHEGKSVFIEHALWG